MLYLSRNDVKRVGLKMQTIIDALEKMFTEKGQGQTEMPPKPVIHLGPDSFIHAMPAYIPSIEAAGIKWVSTHPENPKKNLPAIAGLIILNNSKTGTPLSVMDCRWITAMRTGAATAIAAKYLARKDSSTVGIIACGVQGRSNLEALTCLFDIKKVKAYDIYPEAALKFAAEMSKKLRLDIEVVEKPRQAVTGLDIVITSGPIRKNPKPVIQAGWLDEGSFASAVDYDSYWTGDALAQIDKLATDDIAQMDYYRQIGDFKQTPIPYADIGEIVAGIKPGRQSNSERTLTMNMGIALDDMATAPLIYKLAKQKGIGIKLPL
jgi:ornithine cyclodeaminase/alanine dehydrogenase-like protein (mu-crystallin family)